jgi:voltage-gated sodium channel
MNIVSETALEITKNKKFSGFIFFLIFLSSLLIGIETYPEISSKHRSLLTFLDKLIISFFVVEIGLRILANGKSPWLFFQIRGMCLILL